MDIYFHESIRCGQMKWDLKEGWLSTYFEETLSASGKDKKWTLLAAQAMNDYYTISEWDSSVNFHSMKLLDRLLVRLFEEVRSAKQDVNILMNEK